MEIQNLQVVGKRKNNERLIHDLLFKQHTDNTLDSNLWILNEDFIHYKGISECELRNAKINGELFLREDLTEEEHELARRGRNLPIPVARRAIQNVYRPSTAFEVLIGYWYLHDKERLNFFYNKIKNETEYFT